MLHTIVSNNLAQLALVVRVRFIEAPA